MKIDFYPKAALEAQWQADKKLFAPDAERPPCCLRCGKPLDKHLMVNTVSRFADVYICERCSTDEALRDAVRSPLPLSEWQAVLAGFLPDAAQLPNSTLSPLCAFQDAFQHPEEAVGDWSRPDSELVYARSDYDGSRWWPTWFDFHKERLTQDTIAELDQFMEALFKLPEFKTLDTMTRMCRAYAQPTKEPTEFNLYTQTAHFNIWLRLVTRFRDYNLYAHFLYQ